LFLDIPLARRNPQIRPARLTCRCGSIYRRKYMTAAAPNIIPANTSAAIPATNHFETGNALDSTLAAAIATVACSSLSLNPPLISRRDAALGTPAATFPTKL
jgi:hypothetical protein